jgi:tRNA-modifying protein YgfZ
MPTVNLPDRALITVSGPEAEHLLQNVVTNDLEILKPGELRPGALLTPQGKILFDFLVSRDAEALRIDVRADVADDLARRLMMYRLRAKAEISKPIQADAVVSWQSDSTPSRDDSTTLHDMRFGEANVIRNYGNSAADADGIENWTALRVRHAVAESGADFELGDAFPHDVLLDQNSGVGFRKGCYVGQEVVSRMHHRGTARRRVLLANAESRLTAGASITSNGRDVGTIGSVSGNSAIAIARIDRVKDAVDTGTQILAGDVPVELTIPDWASFTFPAAAEA